jgi:hypothetical protein
MKTTLTVIACALMLMAFPASVSADPVSTDLLTISAGNILVPDHQTGGYEMERCDDQLAVLVLDLPGCEFSEDHLVCPEWWITIGFLSINAGNAGPIPLTGTIQALLEHAGGSVDFRCTWASGQFTQCQILSSVWPFPGATYNFSCQTIEGSLGNWGECFHEHY